MAKALDRTAFLAEPTRLKIAELCSGEALTDEEIAGLLGRPSGSLSQPKTMRAHKALLRGKKRKPSDGRSAAETSHFNPAPVWSEALDEARRQQQRAWTPGEQDLLLIPLHETPAACTAIAGGIEEIEWGARLMGERAGLVIAPQIGTGGTSTIRVVQALGSLNGIARLQLGDVMGPDELRRWSARSVGGSSAMGELPSS
jgi:hypothetical protein